MNESVMNCAVGAFFADGSRVFLVPHNVVATSDVTRMLFGHLIKTNNGIGPRGYEVINLA